MTMHHQSQNVARFLDHDIPHIPHSGFPVAVLVDLFIVISSNPRTRCPVFLIGPLNTMPQAHTAQYLHAHLSSSGRVSSSPTRGCRCPPHTVEIPFPSLSRSPARHSAHRLRSSRRCSAHRSSVQQSFPCRCQIARCVSSTWGPTWRAHGT